MHTKERHLVTIDTSDAEDRAEYDRILNDPMCSVLSEIKEKLTECEYNEEGKLSRKTDRIVLIITYEERKLL